MIIVCDSSPLIALSRIGRLNILKSLYKQILIPSVKEVIDVLIKQEFRLSTQLYQDILELAEE